MKVGMISLGCPKNLVDSEIMLGILNKDGFEITFQPEEADVIIINTCAFIEDAQSEAIETILEMAQYKEQNLKKLIVTGCLSQRYKEEVLSLLPEVDAVVGIDEIEKISDIIKDDEKYFVGEGCGAYPESQPRILTTPPYMAYLKIAEGCDNNCTYCAIPFIRGKFRSRKMEDILKEAEKLAEGGAAEIMVVAQDTTRYGEDIYGESKLAELLESLCKIEKIKWIRVLYTYPERLSDEIINVVRENDKIANYFDIPIQHISDSVLKRMGRRTDGKSIRELIKRIKTRIPDAVIRTSLIAGFPGESEEDFGELEAFVSEGHFSRLGVFAYSKEEGTPAFKLRGHLPEEVKKARADRIMELQNKISKEFCKGFIGKEIEVIVEGGVGDTYFGRSQQDAPEIDGKVFFTGGGDHLLGRFATVKITDADDYDLKGELI